MSNMEMEMDAYRTDCVGDDLDLEIGHDCAGGHGDSVSIMYMVGSGEISKKK